MFEFNTITHAGFETIDVEAFYDGRSWSQRGNMARYNRIKHVRPTERLSQSPSTQNTFYLDDQMSGWEIYGNTIIINATTGVRLGGGRRNTLQNNTFISCDQDIAFDNRGETNVPSTCNSTTSSLFLDLEKLLKVDEEG